MDFIICSPPVHPRHLVRLWQQHCDVGELIPSLPSEVWKASQSHACSHPYCHDNVPPYMTYLVVWWRVLWCAQLRDTRSYVRRWSCLSLAATESCGLPLAFSMWVDVDDRMCWHVLSHTLGCIQAASFLSEYTRYCPDRRGTEGKCGTPVLGVGS